MKREITDAGRHPKTPIVQRPFMLDFRLAAAGLMLAVVFSTTAHAGYMQTNLVSNVSGQAAFTDPNLVNPWGMAYSATSPFWVSDNGTGVSTLYDGSGSKQALTVTIPSAAAGGTARPTGQVFNGGAGFNGDRFLFATEDGTIAGWRGALGTTAELVVNNTAAGANYKGLAIGSNGAGTFIYAANFHTGNIDVYDSIFAPAFLPGAFTDPTLPAGYAPFNIQNLGGSLFVTYAQQDANAQDDVAGAGHGFVDVFDTSGNLQQRLISGGVLDSPWGVALAPADFGEFSNDLLVGNFGDGLINAFDPLTGALLGTLKDGKGNPILIDGLWALGFGNGAGAGLGNELFFTAGPNGETDGLFGKLSAVPEPSTILLLGLGLVALNFTAIRCKKRPHCTS
jgi:uncharacterized protein (TIGR03118 family)